ncbi:cob(I)yrinic acid a,c-diamide adenosyltransferase [Paenibacillus sp. 481]|uniref:cob(I)yrinic acid a,c-diamide adenosyltransferase n=1 Tax=Paenibacillus sp. 481 TaxID=2835869 RepID=UPI001E4A4300|nr:cob(I)yrinic acid a,c-diamide adenosyltransferase [Paenibacillus sp. 481]UHA72333.1 cob(I)yrinic acid a,c-diamide adenosyltransferase [Paenibacillus sp. 481]
MNIYTRTGDQGMTSLIGGRVPKDHIRVDAYGELDELNSFIGCAVSCCTDDAMDVLRQQLTMIQHEVFDCGSDAAYAETRQGKVIYKVHAELAQRLEQWIDEHDAAVPAISKFILPGGHAVASALHVCRTVCRRAERRLITLSQQEAVNPEVLKYVNRLSDYFFVAARRANALAEIEDVAYARSADVFTTRKERNEKYDG